VGVDKQINNQLKFEAKHYTKSASCTSVKFLEATQRLKSYFWKQGEDLVIILTSTQHLRDIVKVYLHSSCSKACEGKIDFMYSSKKDMPQQRQEESLISQKLPEA
jgi:hypothetical protein